MSLPDRDVLLCRGCCCGDVGKHPRTDHDGQRDVLLDLDRTDGAERADGVRVRVVDCLDQCDRSNVVLVRDFTGGRRPQDTWLGGVLNPATTDRLVDWVRVGGSLPRELEPHRFGQDSRQPSKSRAKKGGRS